MSRPRCEFYRLAPQFVVPDVVRSAEYYRDKYGFEILGYFLDPPVFAIVRRDGAEIHLGKSDRGEVKVNDSVRKGLGTDAYIFISDIIGLHKELKTRGANIVEGPVERPYDRIEITVVDDDGYQIVFGE
ncbi:MAG TPA: VOC family protein [Pyrinomonadaceae bacterium]|nr:VOC family protein [Pyrinomonadaceae bacterium]